MGQHLRSLRAAVATLLAAGAMVVSVSGAMASGIYTSGTTGYDISWPQCDIPYPVVSAYPFGIVGVTSGHAFRNNPCFAPQYTWATRTMAPESVYLNLNEDIGTTATYGDSGPYGACGADTLCHALNYGYNAASSAYTYAGQVKTFAATMWWLDIETENSWSEDDRARNRAVIIGAVQFLQVEHHFAVGIYSTASMWLEITGSWQNGLPVWLGGGIERDARTLCGIGFTGGPVYLVQYAKDGYDGDSAC